MLSSPLGIYNNHTAPIEEGAEEESRANGKGFDWGIEEQHPGED